MPFGCVFEGFWVILGLFLKKIAFFVKIFAKKFGG